MAYVYGTYQVIEEAKDFIVGLMNDLKTAMSAVTPKISYVYTGHNNAAMKLNAVSVDVMSVAKDDEGTNAPIQPIMTYYITMSIRVHVNYFGRYIDGPEVARLINSIDNYLSTHLRSGQYRIWNFGDALNFQAFEDSQTVGGELTFVVHRTIDHTQA